MANAHTHGMASFGTPVGVGGLVQNLGVLFSARRKQNAERARIRRELESYSDRELADLGIGRSDIEAVASGRFTR
jgi:uncharacterized protein YjiS (DUF1127 family)